MGPWPMSFDELDDNQVIELAKKVYERFGVVNRLSPENDDLLRRWAAVCMEMDARGITDTVTEGEHGDVVKLVKAFGGGLDEPDFLSE